MMKKILFSLGFVFTLINTPIFAAEIEPSNFDMELYRTKTNPGFFAVRISNYSHLKPLELNNIFVRNYDVSEKNEFIILEDFVTELGNKVVNFEEVDNFKNSETSRVIYLGNKTKTENSLVFIKQSNSYILDDFNAFFDNYLQKDVYLKDLSLDFNENISNIYPKKILQATGKPLYFVGKFEKPTSTEIKILAHSSDGIVLATPLLNFNDFSKFSVSENLPDLWEKFYLATQEKTTETSEFLFSLFPIIIGSFGLLIIWIGVLFIRKNDESDDEFVDLFDEDADEDELKTDNLTLPSKIVNTNKSVKRTPLNKSNKIIAEEQAFDSLFDTSSNESLEIEDSGNNLLFADYLASYEKRTKEESLLMKYILSDKNPEDLIHSSMDKIEANLPFYLQRR